ncbi:hypothetical protein F8154_02370 [Alkaliphilus pronyensis]|uniref:Uncharacterized protein n=1 Tax=Alkaliphilus pronyensis TaxID=1482732 RepID=A0A6I0F765_9FIRM|nr:hypothetical protein F8154_02370 [Alkaliphilus pronyensis]
MKYNITKVEKFFFIDIISLNIAEIIILMFLLFNKAFLLNTSNELLVSLWTGNMVVIFTVSFIISTIVFGRLKNKSLILKYVNFLKKSSKLSCFVIFIVNVLLLVIFTYFITLYLGD